VVAALVLGHQERRQLIVVIRLMAAATSILMLTVLTAARSQAAFGDPQVAQAAPLADELPFVAADDDGPSGDDGQIQPTPRHRSASATAT